MNSLETSPASEGYAVETIPVESYHNISGIGLTHQGYSMADGSRGKYFPDKAKYSAQGKQIHYVEKKATPADCRAAGGYPVYDMSGGYVGCSRSPIANASHSSYNAQGQQMHYVEKKATPADCRAAGGYPVYDMSGGYVGCSRSPIINNAQSNSTHSHSERSHSGKDNYYSANGGFADFLNTLAPNREEKGKAKADLAESNAALNVAIAAQLAAQNNAPVEKTDTSMGKIFLIGGSVVVGLVTIGFIIYKIRKGHTASATA